MQDVKIEDETKNKYAMKSFPPIRFQQKNISLRYLHHHHKITSHETMIRREIAILRRLIHPNVIYLKDVNTTTSTSMIIFFRLLKNNYLKDLIYI